MSPSLAPSWPLPKHLVMSEIENLQQKAEESAKKADELAEVAKESADYAVLKQAEANELAKNVNDFDSELELPTMSESELSFEEAIQAAPTLKKIEDYTSQYNYNYLKFTLRTIADGDLHRQYTSPLKIATEYVFVLSQIKELLQNEIDTITRTYASGDHVFSPTDRDFVLNELTKYLEYFERNAYKEIDRVNMDFQEALFE